MLPPWGVTAAAEAGAAAAAGHWDYGLFFVFFCPLSAAVLAAAAAAAATMDRNEVGDAQAHPPPYVDIEAHVSDEEAALRLHQQLNEEGKP